jgi:DNA polymerase-3 subunit gamma/tau
MPVAPPTETRSDAGSANTPEVEPAANADPPDLDTLRSAVIAALANGGHASAAELLNAAAWAMEGSSLHIEVPGVGKKMLSLTVNAAAEKIVKQELQRLRGPLKFTLAPGVGTASPAPAPVILSGSIHETALANPLVQRAREIFNAEVRSVVDLREKP